MRLRPGAFTALYGVPADELTDVRVPLARRRPPAPLLDAAARRRPPRSARRRGDARSPTSRRSRASPATASATCGGGCVAATGHSPRKLARIGRMQALLAAGRGESWARTAAEFGYYDESHMINDVRALADATPQMMLAERARAA